MLLEVHWNRNYIRFTRTQRVLSLQFPSSALPLIKASNATSRGRTSRRQLDSQQPLSHRTELRVEQRTASIEEQNWSDCDMTKAEEAAAVLEAAQTTPIDPFSASSSGDGDDNLSRLSPFHVDNLGFRRYGRSRSWFMYYQYEYKM